MADVTINDLPNLPVSSTNELVHTNGTTTGKATVTALRAALSIPASQINSDWNASSGVAQILNKPTVGLGGMQAFTSSGTFTVPAGVTRLLVTVVGGGGTGGCLPGCGGGTGGNGGLAEGVVSVTPGQSIGVTVGGTSGTSQFSSLIGYGGSPGSPAGRGRDCPRCGTYCTGGAAGAGGGAAGGAVNDTNSVFTNYGTGTPGCGPAGRPGIVIIKW